MKVDGATLRTAADREPSMDTSSRTVHLPVSNNISSRRVIQRKHDVDSSRSNDTTKRGVSKIERDRLLMREWLERSVEEGSVEGLSWSDRDQRLIQVTWKHGSSSEWCPSDSSVFESWARHRGKYTSGCEDYKRWKANFRCAINSLTDVKLVTSAGGHDAYRIYKLLPPLIKTKTLKSTKRNKTIRHQLSLSSTDPVSSDARSKEASGFGNISKYHRELIADRLNGDLANPLRGSVNDDATHKQIAIPCNMTISALQSLIPTTVEEISSESEERNAVNSNAAQQTESHFINTTPQLQYDDIKPGSENFRLAVLSEIYPTSDLPDAAMLTDHLTNLSAVELQYVLGQDFCFSVPCWSF